MADSDIEPICFICKEYGAASACGAGHPICEACVRASELTAQKLSQLTGMEFPALCPYADCEGVVKSTPRVAPQRLARLVKVETTNPEYASVADKFMESMKTSAIQSIYRVENPALKAVHEACRARMTKETRIVHGKDVGANEKLVFHGTTREAAGSIIREGFDTHRAGSAHGTAYGAGIYVGTEARVSVTYCKPDSTGTATMFLCSALLGDTTGRDSQSGPNLFVVYREQQVLPLYIIYFK